MEPRILAVFDLDYTVWEPEMYQLMGKPRFVEAPEHMSKSEVRATKTVSNGKVLSDKSGSLIRVFPGASHALADINKLKEDGIDIRAAVASRTDEPDWADFCMKNLVVKDGTTLSKCFGNLVEISFHDKTKHFHRLHKKTGIPYEQMVFFDNEKWNIQSVSKLGVICIYTPDGMKEGHWEEAKRKMQL